MAYNGASFFQFLGLNICDMNLVDVTSIGTLVVSLFALYISYCSRAYAQKAVMFSLFDKRYNFYHRLRIAIELFDEVHYDSEKEERGNELTFLYWEAKYIFGQEIEELLRKLLSLLDTFVKSESKEDLQALKDQKNILLNAEGMLNLDSYFNKYLFDKDFKNPMPNL